MFRAGRDFVELKIVKVAESIERTIRLQLKLTNLSNNFAIRTRVLTFCSSVSFLFYANYLRCLQDLWPVGPRSFPPAFLIFALLEMSGLEDCLSFDLAYRGLSWRFSGVRLESVVSPPVLLENIVKSHFVTDIQIRYLKVELAAYVIVVVLWEDRQRVICRSLLAQSVNIPK